ncbi:MAG: MarC family protein [Thermoplasmatota archaeon]
MDATQFFAITVSVFAIVNPLGAIPVYVSLCHRYTASEKLRVVTKAVAVGFGVLVLFGLAGQKIFEIFSITIPAFRIAGGILIFKVAFDLLHGERPRSDSNEIEIADALERESVGITPLGVPLLTGPGAITTVMILVAGTTSFFDATLVYLACAVTFAAAFILLAFADRILAYMGRSGLMVFSRIMGLILAAIAVEFIVRGLHDIMPTLVTGGI